MSVALASVFVCVVYPGLFLNGIVLRDCPFAGCLLSVIFLVPVSIHCQVCFLLLFLLLHCFLVRLRPPLRRRWSTAPRRAR